MLAEYGKRLHMVAVLAPKEMVTKAVDNNDKSIFQRVCWRFGKTTLKSAPGKRTSSPSPEFLSAQSRPRDMTPTW